MTPLITLLSSKPNIRLFSASFNDVFKWNLSCLLLIFFMNRIINVLHHCLFKRHWCGTLNSGTAKKHTDLFYLLLYADCCICMDLPWTHFISIALQYIFRMWHFDIWLNAWQPTTSLTPCHYHYFSWFHTPTVDRNTQGCVADSTWEPSAWINQWKSMRINEWLKTVLIKTAIFMD